MTDLPELPQRPVRIESVDLDGDELVAAVLEGEGVAVPIRLVCDALGLATQPQSDRLREHDVLSQGLRVVRVPIGGRIRSVLAILHTHIAFWLATITPSQVSEEVRPKLIRYQKELVVVLNALYGPALPALPPAPPAATPGAAIVPAEVQQQLAATIKELRTLRDVLLASLAEQQTTREQVESLGERLQTVEDVVEDLRQIAKVSAVQAEYIQRAIKRLATRYQQRTQAGANYYERLFAQFRIDLGIPRYDALPASKYDAALAWLRQQAAELLPDDPDALPPLQEKLL
jgi:phage FluMu protein gp41